MRHRPPFFMGKAPNIMRPMVGLDFPTMNEKRISPGAVSAGTAAALQPNAFPRILVVEDEEQIGRMTMAMLSGAGFAVNIARDGAAAWDALQLHRYDLMVTDNSMPKVTGIELLQMLHTAGMVLPVIMATGLLPQEEFIRAPLLRPAVTLLKPYSHSQLLATVNALVRGAASNGEQIEPMPNRPDQSPVIG